MTSERVPTELRDARPFLSFHLRARANELGGDRGTALHALARWVENLPNDEPSMRRIAATDALDYEAGAFRCGGRAARLVDEYDAKPETEYARWLGTFADAVVASD